MHAPVILFVYNRPWHTRQTIEALQKNELASESELFIFSDGAKNVEDENNVREVRNYLKSIREFKRVEVIQRDRNWGLANNIIDGVTKIVNNYGKIIVLEDDIVTSPYFLKFMNDALEFYEDKEKVMHISGYMFPINTEELPDTFFLKPTSCWGWATWSRAWKHFERNPEKQIKALTRKQRKDFNLNNSYDYWQQVESNYKGKLYTWAIFWYLSVYLCSGLSLHPKESFVKNIGHDGEGTHCGKTNVFDVDLNTMYPVKFTTNINEDSKARERLEEFFKSIRPSLVRRVISKLLPSKIKYFLRKIIKNEM